MKTRPATSSISTWNLPRGNTAVRGWPPRLALFSYVRAAPGYTSLAARAQRAGTHREDFRPVNIPRMDSIALGSFGYTEDEARFLCLVATHSGYFTCQQFVRFIHSKPGKRSLTFVRKLLEKGHASARPCLRNGQVYHLFSRNLYEAIGKDNVRFRRKHSTEYIRTRLAALDFILGKLDYKFFETEQEKVRHFTEQLGIYNKYLPAKRYAGAIP